MTGVLALAIAAFAPAARAQAPAESHAKLELLAEDAAGKASVTWVGILFRLDPGWHVYWQNPGDSGEPPKVKWDLPPGLKAGDIRWPTPIRLGSGSVIDYGYENQVLLMVPIQAGPGAPPEAAKQIAADVKYVVCREVCIPGKADLKLAATSDGRAQVVKMFAETRERLPRKMPAGWRVSATQNKDRFSITADIHKEVRSAAFFPMDAGEIENSAPQQFAALPDGFRLTLKKSDQLLKPVASLHGLVVLGPDQAYDVTAPIHGQSD